MNGAVAAEHLPADRGLPLGSLCEQPTHSTALCSPDSLKQPWDSLEMGIRLLVPACGRSLILCKAAWQRLQVLGSQTLRAKGCTGWAPLFPQSSSDWIRGNYSELSLCRA